MIDSSRFRLGLLVVTLGIWVMDLPQLSHIAPEIVTQTPSDITSSQFVTYLGGSGVDDCDDIAVDAAGSIYLACHSTSKGFPGFKGRKE